MSDERESEQRKESESEREKGERESREWEKERRHMTFLEKREMRVGLLCFAGTENLFLLLFARL
jgi:hypothetical protein